MPNNRTRLAAPAAFSLTCLLALASLSGCGSDNNDNLNGNAAPQPKASASNTAATNTPGNAASTAPKMEGSIKADPNPVPAGEGNGKTTISWTTKGTGGVVKVYVSDNGLPEKILAQAATGSVEVPWIVSGRSYTFFLYAEANGDKRLMDKIQVTRSNQ